ncbi:hypothetical protein BST81_18905 [Leptolyngbya sp. 'hensonii']|uniref:DUF423 domain-containing protein n=1 Tax=Leptolyngbya sp. 'hensonii' TaxID=1922337 RepID=UPI00094F677F|nr:DUF423 domain-containing protein [Leptolyngbya sp. 'hensonii']OLP16768.1 hypothetical protein BST81_18905 [Leptolyngbya sp. 'hensonii']
MARFFLTIAPILAALAVVAGAFASHALREKVSDRALEIFQTGAQYQMYHALALLAVGLLMGRLELPSTLLTLVGFAFLLGIVLFSGSLYALALSGTKILGAITPLGGAAFILGWLALAYASWTIQDLS